MNHLIIGGSVGISCLYYFRKTVAYNTLKAYTHFLEKWDELAAVNSITSFEYFNYNYKSFNMIPAYTKSDILEDTSISSIKYENKVFYSYSNIIDLRGYYLDFINSGEKETTLLYSLLKSTSRDSILACTINVESSDYTITSDFDITELVRSFAFPGNRLFLSEPYVLPMLFLLSKFYPGFPDIDIKSYLLKPLDKDKDNLLNVYMDLNLKINYTLITNEAEQFTGYNMSVIYDNEGKLDIKVY
jgi:hypothetical protein